MKKENKSEVWNYVASNLTILVFALVFSLFSLIFIYDKIPNVVRFIVSFVFLAPTLYISFSQGRRNGEKLYKQYAKTSLSDIHNGEYVKFPYYKCVFHVIGVVVPLTVIFIISVIMKSTVLRLVAMIFEFPVALMFSSIGVIKTDVVTPATLAVFLPYTFVLAGTFVLGYILRIRALKRQHGALQSELRTFDN